MYCVKVFYEDHRVQCYEVYSSETACDIANMWLRTHNCSITIDKVERI